MNKFKVWTSHRLGVGLGGGGGVKGLDRAVNWSWTFNLGNTVIFGALDNITMFLLTLNT